MNLLKGRSLNSIFEQCIQIFIDDYLRNIIIKGKIVPLHILELCSGIKKDMKILKEIFKPYRELINPKFFSNKEIRSLLLRCLYFLESTYGNINQ